MQLAQLAALVFPEDCRYSRADDALRKAWLLFAHSKAFCMELQNMSAQELFLAYATTQGINHTSKVINKICDSAPPKQILRFYPDGNKADAVCDFLRGKQARAIRERLKKYCRANKEEGNDSPYKSLLHDTKRTDEDGNTYHEFTIEFLTKLIEFEKQVKSAGAKGKNQPLQPVLTTVVRDDDDLIFDFHGPPGDQGGPVNTIADPGTKGV